MRTSSYSNLIWENAKDELRRAVTAAWQAEMVKEPAAPDREATREEMFRWTSAAREVLIVSIDKLLKEAIEKHGA
jgi:hypothetical protein